MQTDEFNETMVFLGGECGMSTWRTDTAIPLLERAGISYYNPQIGFGEWHEGLVAVEAEVKRTAQHILMVIGSSTRGASTIQEATSLAMRWHDNPQWRRDLFLVVHDIPVGTVIDGVQVGKQEAKDLNAARAYLRADLAVWRPDLTIHDTVEDAVHAIIRDCCRRAGWLR